MKTNRDYTVKISNNPEVTIPKGTRVSHKTASGIDENYHFVADWNWYKPEVKGFARKMMLHDFTHRGINVPKEFVDYEDKPLVEKRKVKNFEPRNGFTGHGDICSSDADPGL